jgi:Zn-finger protein
VIGNVRFSEEFKNTPSPFAFNHSQRDCVFCYLLAYVCAEVTIYARRNVHCVADASEIRTCTLCEALQSQKIDCLLRALENLTAASKTTMTAASRILCRGQWTSRDIIEALVMSPRDLLLSRK